MTEPAQGRIALVINGGEGYGVASVFGELSRTFPGFGYDVTVLSTGPGKLADRFAADGVDIRLYPGAQQPKLSGGTLAKLASLPRILGAQVPLTRWRAAQLRQIGAALAVVRSPQDVLSVGWAARSAGTRAVWMMPNSVDGDYPFDINRRVYGAAFRHLPIRALGNSRYTVSTLGRSAAGQDYVHLGFDPDRMAAGRPDDDLGLRRADDEIVFGIFARMREEKGQRLFLEALNAVRPGLAGIRVLVLGGPLDSDYARDLRQWIDANGLSDRIEMPGAVDGAYRYVTRCDVIVNSRLDPEPYGVSVIEALHLARPVLAHKAGGPGETVIDGVTGWLIDAPTRAAFELGIARALADRDRWPAIGAAAQAYAREYFTNTVMVRQVLAKAGLTAQAGIAAA